MSDLKQLVEEFVRVDDKVKDTTQNTKPLREQQKALKAQIVQAMTDNDVTQINIRDGTEQLRLTERKKLCKPTKKDDIIDKMAAYFGGDQAKAEDLYTYVFEDCDEEYVTSFSRTKKRKAAPQ